MSAYWIAHVTVHNNAQYKKYQNKAKDVFEHYEAQFLARSNLAENLEGEGFQRHVIIQFKDIATALECYHSHLYQAAKKYRDKACTTIVTIIPDITA